MAFSVFVEMLNLRMKAKKRPGAPVKLREPYTGELGEAPAAATE